MSTRPRKVPAYRLHKPTGQAVVRLDGRDFYLGKHDTEASQERYRRLGAEWLTSGRQPPNHSAHRVAAQETDLSVNELTLAYWRYAEQHYRNPDGTPTRELDNLADALRPLRKLYGHTAARAFGPLALRAVRDEMVRSGLCRTTVNARVNRARRLFKWAAGVELLPPSVYQALQAVPGLLLGRSEATEAKPVQPAPEGHVEQTLPFLPAPVRAMVELQRLTGCRPGEVMVMRAIDLTTTGPVWTYRPASHKNRHRGRDRVIFLGPQAQEVLKPFLTTNLEAYLFSPRAYVEAMYAARAARRKTKRTPSELKRQRKRAPRCAPGERYTRRSYNVAVARACRKAGVPAWSPLQLRHTAATAIRARFGLEAAKVILGHSRVETSQIYAERDLGRAAEIMGEIG
jgi:integrase